jgi:prepilin signal peptidase PulO-like enzyme (type II secretory pathway)
MQYDLIFACVLTLVASYTDLRRGPEGGKIPDVLTLGGAAMGLILQVLTTYSSQASQILMSPSERGGIAMRAGAFSLLGFAVCGLVPVLLYRHKALGLGDVKLLAALGSVLQYQRGMEVQLYSFILLALLAPAWLAYHGRLLAALKGSLAILVNPVLPQKHKKTVDESALSSFRFAPFCFGATLLVTFLYWKR